MRRFGSPEHFTHMVRQLQDGMMARVMDDGMVSEAFEVINGSPVLCHADGRLLDEHSGIPINYRTDGYLLNIQRMQTPTSVSATTVHNLLMLSHDTQINDEVARRISKANQAFNRLQASVWDRHGLQLSRKLKIY
ncbi:unnamed protein product [Dibothriocephalus latus]|uniref:Uncharacterized protein n=1 Tax=Dibothriocephalus latus TaxID=60516 RepID=A0A3P7NAV5_DIBLA|nr:unnamed protein product [Dibothriocephalus latus]